MLDRFSSHDTEIMMAKQFRKRLFLKCRREYDNKRGRIESEENYAAKKGKKKKKKQFYYYLILL